MRASGEHIILFKSIELTLIQYWTYTHSISSIYHTIVPILRLRKNGIARPCIYIDVTSLALYIV
jgi:hypothetical protein